MQRPEDSAQQASGAAGTPVRLLYRAPRLHRLGAVADVTAAVSKQGNMDGYKAFRTG